MSVLKQSPFVKLLIPFIIGITLVIQFPQLGYYSTFLLILSLVSFGIFTFRQKNFLYYQLASVSVYLVFLSLGSFTAYNANPQNHKQNLEKAGLDGIYLIRVNEIPQIKSKTIKIQAKVIGRIKDRNKIIKAEETVLLYFDKRISMPRPGDELIVKCNFKTIPEPENPYQFNYKRFLKWQGIYYQSFITNSRFVANTNINSATLFQNLSYHGSEYLKNLFKENIKDPTALAVTESLIFGYKDDIPKDLIDSYSRTGTLHVLAVSGLHVIIVFILLNRCLWFLDKRRYGVLIKTFIVIICVWGYCILTGMVPSIIRAGLMITVVLVGKALNRQAHIFNTIAVSAFIILLVNPFWLLNVGFQLSFTAVIGIVYLQEYLMPLWTPPNWFFRQVWEILIITICAQMATFPLSIYYFNQFPNYFILSNLLIIPLTTIIIYSGIAMVVFSKIPLLLSLFSILAEQLISLTNYLVVSIEKFPLSFSDGIKINLVQFILIYICAGCFIFWLLNSNKRLLIYTLAILVCITAISSFDSIKIQREKKIVIFNIPNHNVLLISNGKKGILISDINIQGKEMFYIRGWLIHKRLWPVHKTFTFNNIEQNNITIEEMDFSLREGVMFFKGFALNLSYKNLGYLTHKHSYIIPNFFNLNAIYDDNMRETVFIGQVKSKRLQKKVKYFLSKYHNSVIYETYQTGLISLNLNY